MSPVDASSRVVTLPAFVIHARRWRETSLLVEVLTSSEGRVGIVARGVGAVNAHALRAALQPWQFVAVSFLRGGELSQLRHVEALDTAPRFQGQAVLASFYANELVLRLTSRHDPVPSLYVAYAELRHLLSGSEWPLAWALRRFERDVLSAVGLGVDFLNDTAGDPVDPEQRYWLDPEAGLRRVVGATSAATFRGQAAIDLGTDRLTDPKALSSLRLPLRAILSHHLGPVGLQSWALSPAGSGSR